MSTLQRRIERLEHERGLSDGDLSRLTDGELDARIMALRAAMGGQDVAATVAQFRASLSGESLRDFDQWAVALGLQDGCNDG